jgi:hypothetical protein
MVCSLTYDVTVSRVEVTATSLGSTVTTATVERSDDGGSTFSFVRGGLAVPVSGGATQLTVNDYEFIIGNLTYRVRGYNSSNVLVTTFTCAITVNQSATWLKSVERPFLNRPLDCTLNPSPLDRTARIGLFDVIGRSFPVATTDVRLAYEFRLEAVTLTYDEQLLLDYLLASGDVLYLQPNATFPVEATFAIADTTNEARPVRNRDCGQDIRRFTIDLIEIEVPEDDVVGILASWYTVVVTYATWSDVIAAHATWAALLTNLIGDPSEVIIP